MTHLTKRRLEAISEALHFRLMGEIDEEEISPLSIKDYEAAQEWVEKQLSKRVAEGRG